MDVLAAGWWTSLLVACRVAPLTLTAPVFARLPLPLRASLAAALSFGLATLLPTIHGELATGPLLLLGLREIVLGWILALAVQWPLWAFGEASRLSVSALGLTARGHGLVRAMELTAAAAFVALGGLRALVQGLLTTYRSAPLSTEWRLDAWTALSESLGLFARIVALALELSLPFLLALAVLDVVIACFARGLHVAAFEARRSPLRWLLAAALFAALLVPSLEQLPAALRTAAALLAGLAERLFHH